MSDAPSSATTTGFLSADARLGALDAQGIAGLLAAAADLTLIVDAKGVIIDAAASAECNAPVREWVGRPWIDTVTIESRPKIEALLRDAQKGTTPRGRQVNHPAPSGPDLPIRYSAVPAGGAIVAFGRDLRPLAALQQRVAEAQQEMEREYHRIRNAEKRYRLLFQLSSEAILILDGSGSRIAEANPAAVALVGKAAKKIVGAPFGDLFDEASRRAAQSFVTALLVAPRVDNVHAQLSETRESLLLSGALFRQDGAANIIVILSRMGGATALSGEKTGMLNALERMPDAFALTDSNRRILAANAAFVDLAQAGSEEQMRGESIERWIGRPGVDAEVLFANLQTHGVVRHFSTLARGQYGSSEDVEISAVDVAEGARHYLGFCIRSAGWRAGRERLGGHELPRTAEQFADLVGRVPLKNLVRETTDLIERLCIEAALELTHDNRASAAEMLGLSRQGLYTKLRRYGLGDLDDDEAAGDGE
ncbi:transcriptional regulator PpsR [Methylocystis rosea]|uniref:transcriptional regulator PpsR n=1 Tax=Methylocystis rosea TaxID=173366 RepID=UPI0003658AB1|nr:transcriptional regulator PpsR [Methylocystis rosea]